MDPEQRMAGTLLAEELLRAFDLHELLPGLREGVRSGMDLREIMALLSYAERRESPFRIDQLV